MSQVFMCSSCGATRSSLYHRKRADLTCSRCGTVRPHSLIHAESPTDSRERANVSRQAETRLMLEEIAYLEDIAERLHIEIVAHWEAGDPWLHHVAARDWYGARRWVAVINPDATLKGRLHALREITCTVVDPSKWSQEDLRLARRHWVHKPRTGDLVDLVSE